MNLPDPLNPDRTTPDARSIMPPRLMRLEDRIVLDAAGPADGDPDANRPDDAGVDHVPASDHGAHDADQPGSGPDAADQAGRIAGSAVEKAVSALLCPDNDHDTPRRVLVVSSAVEQAEALAGAAAGDVLTIVFDGDSTTLDGLLQQIRAALDGQTADSIGLATHGLGGDGFQLAGGCGVNLEALQNPELRDFWRGLAELVEPDGRIDVLACDAAAGPRGTALVTALEELTGVDFAASVDETGNGIHGGDWILETDHVSVRSIYFDPQRLSGFTEVLAPPIINDTDPGNVAGGGQGPVVVDAGVTVDDNGNGNLEGAAVRIKTGFVAGEDQLSFNSALAGGYGIAGSYDAATGELLLSGSASAAEYQQVLRTVTYENTSLTPDTAAREIFFVLGDNFTDPGIYFYNPQSGHYYHLVDAMVNRATAEADAAGRVAHGLQGYLGTVTSGAENALFAGLVPVMPFGKGAWLGASDAASDGEWYWVAGPEAGTQFWQETPPGPVNGMYSNWGGGEPNNAGPSYLMIVNNGSWQDEAGGSSQRYIVEYGGLSSDSEGSLAASVMLTVIDQNDAPLLDDTGVMSLLAIDEDDAGNPGSTVASIIASAGGDRITDADPGAVEGIAVIGIDNTHGTWQYSIDGGSSWHNVGPVADSNALLLRDTDLLRFRPDADWNGTLTSGVTLRAWDRTSGSAGSYADASLSGGTTAFSTATETASLVVNNVNDDPTTSDPLVDQTATEDSHFTYQFGADAFSDVDAGDTLVYSATLADGSALPDWLTFDAAARTFSGTPTNGDVGALSVKVTAEDGHGGTASQLFTITIGNTNDAPTIDHPLVDQHAAEDAVFRYQFAPGTFADVDAGDTLTYSATLADGSRLPSWLAFDPVTRTFTGTPTNADVGTLNVKVTADDGHGGKVSDVFGLTISNANDAPTVENPLVGQVATEGSGFTYQFAPNTFDDVDVGDTLSYSATLADGNPLPKWLAFDAATRRFVGMPGGADVGTLTVKVTADDGHGATVSDVFSITVLRANVAPPDHGAPAEPPRHVDGNQPAPDSPDIAPDDRNADGAVDSGDALDGGDAADWGDSPDGDAPPEAGGGEASSGARAAADTAGAAVASNVRADRTASNVHHHEREEELVETAELLSSQITGAMFSGDLLNDDRQPVEFREVWNTILGAYADSGEEVAAYLQSAFRAVTESALIYQGSEQCIDAMNHELALGAAAGVEPAVDALLAAVYQARDDVKLASTQLETAILAAAQAGKEDRFDQVLEDVIGAALERLMAANEHLFIESQALAAASAVLRDARINGEQAADEARVDSAVAQAKLAARAEISEMRKSWDRVAQDVFAAFVARLVAQQADADDSAQSD